jgi:hypothetical protein
VIIEGTLQEKPWPIDRNKGWDVAFILERWRKPNGPWSEAPVYVYIPMGTKAAAASAARAHRGKSAVRVTVASVRPQGDYIARAAGKPPITKITLVNEPKRPKSSYRDAVLGTLKVEPAFGWVSTRRKLGGSRVELTIEVADTDDEAKVMKAIARARPIVKQCETRLAAMRDAMTKKLLSLYNRKWRDKGRPELDAKSFRAKIEKPVELQVSARSATIRFSAGGLFTDHAIEVTMSASGKIGGISLA